MLLRKDFMAARGRSMIHLLTLYYGKRLAVLGFLISFCACQSTSEKISGKYEANLSSGPGAVRQLTLSLGEDQTAAMTTDYRNQANPVTQRGSWAKSERDSITVFFVEKSGRMFLDTLGFRIEGSQLLLRDTDYGSEKVTLMRKTR